MLLDDISLQTLSFLLIFAFSAGFVDSIVGGGGMIQLPALLIFLPQFSIPTIIGTHKLASVSGTLVAASQYIKQVKVDWKVMLPAVAFTGIFALMGARLVSSLDKETLRPIILVLLVLVLIYTLVKKDLGTHHAPKYHGKVFFWGVMLTGAVLGFYDGFFGPGMGSFLIFTFVSIFYLDFLHASAYAKIMNCASNVPAIIYFMSSGDVLYKVAIPLAIANILGSIVGTKLALKKGSAFVRIFFVVVVIGVILRFGYDIFFKH
ncbi:sulfite exporter TauE/SafE family protein [Flectobacillus roseus]|uniref:Probable membrane transporter protein n=1 Tax=Flectobacillus roseus TaxID=502259 RepID=A0ABT6Y2R6_9BACT|nr:TSUP family transporter [Flectobacillus roseus]MDI9857857.1 TSUP family transporter [Flectobacillus roseus]